MADEICKNYKVTATQIGWNEVDVVINAEELLKHKADTSLGVTEENAQSMWIGFGVVAPTGATGSMRKIDVVNGLNGTPKEGSFNVPLNTSDKNN